MTVRDDGTWIIDHIGVLVPDLEAGVARWSAMLGCRFSPAARYRTHHYVDHSGPAHLHDARIAFSDLEGPRVELMEATGDGTHGPAQLGIHHLGVNGVADPEAVLAALRDRGLREDGVASTADGLIHLFFTDPALLDGVRIEVVSTRPSPAVADDGSPLPRDPVTGRPDYWRSV
jgi:catechol 2,3-dioxygenase-like lactoylglutathione lyase family enzyme